MVGGLIAKLFSFCFLGSWSKTSQPNTLMASGGDLPSRAGPQQVVFEIVSAKTVVEGRKKFVVGTPLVLCFAVVQCLPD